MSYPTPQEFVEALAAQPMIDRAAMHIETDIGAEQGFDTAVQHRAVLTVTPDARELTAVTVTDIGLTAEGLVIRAWFPNDTPHWAAVAIAAVRDGWVV